MNANARQLELARAERNRTRGAFDTRLAQVKTDLAARGVGGRIADKVGEDAKAVLDEAREVADAHRGIVIGTVTAIVLWLLRNPLIALFDRLFGRNGEDAGEGWRDEEEDAFDA